MSALVLAAALAATPLGHDTCGNALVQHTAATGALHERKLGELPRARVMRAVIRRIYGCEFDEVRQASGERRNVPAGPARASVEPAQSQPPADPVASPPTDPR